MAYRRSIIQLKPDCRQDDFTLVKLQQNYLDGRTEKREVPCTYGASIEAILYCRREFLETAKELDFDTGNKFFNNFCRILRGAAKDDCNIVIMHIPNRTPALFFAAIKAWKAEMIMPSARQNMVDYLKVLNKPRNMTVEAFVNRIKVMTWYITDIPFPGADPPIISATKLKNIIFRAMPTAWQTNFLCVNIILTTTVLQLQQLMSQKQEFAAPQNNGDNTN
jgi:hypothetical protein